jgi:tetratricopeptide (TPR) repeat protein
MRSAKTVGRPLLSRISLALLALALPMQSRGQTAAVDSPAAAQAGTQPLDAMVDRLGLEPATANMLRQALDAQDYVSGEKLLLAEIDKDPHSPRAGKLLAFDGSVYFLNRDYLNAAIAWKKSNAITPLDQHLQFSLAMAYLKIAKPEWARTELESLAAKNPSDALYPYWLGRLDYDAQHFDAAFAHFKQAIALNPGMARAYDNLGLCYYRDNRNDEAIASFKKAIELDKTSAHPSPWPYLNLAITQQFVDKVPDAEENVREAIRIDPNFAEAHFQLGLVLESRGRLEDAVAELREAARLNATYAEPHMAMARIYRQLGKTSEAQEEVKVYLRLHPHQTP